MPAKMALPDQEYCCHGLQSWYSINNQSPFVHNAAFFLSVLSLMVMTTQTTKAKASVVVVVNVIVAIATVKKNILL